MFYSVREGQLEITMMLLKAKASPWGLGQHGIKIHECSYEIQALLKKAKKMNLLMLMTNPDSREHIWNKRIRCDFKNCLTVNG